MSEWPNDRPLTPHEIARLGAWHQAGGRWPDAPLATAIKTGDKRSLSELLWEAMKKASAKAAFPTD